MGIARYLRTTGRCTVCIAAATLGLDAAAVPARPSVASASPASGSAIPAYAAPAVAAPSSRAASVGGAANGAPSDDAMLWLSLLGCAIFVGGQMSRRKAVRVVLS